MKPLRRPVSCGVDEETARPIGWSLPSGCFIADSPVRHGPPDVEAGARRQVRKSARVARRDPDCLWLDRFPLQCELGRN